MPNSRESQTSVNIRVGNAIGTTIVGVQNIYNIFPEIERDQYLENDATLDTKLARTFAEHMTTQAKRFDDIAQMGFVGEQWTEIQSKVREYFASSTVAFDALLAVESSVRHHFYVRGDLELRNRLAHQLLDRFFNSRENHELEPGLPFDRKLGLALAESGIYTELLSHQIDADQYRNAVTSGPLRNWAHAPSPYWWKEDFRIHMILHRGLAKIYYLAGDIKRAREASELVIAASTAAGWSPFEAGMYGDRCLWTTFLGNPADAVEDASIALKIARRLPQKRRLLVEVIRNTNLLRSLNRFDEAKDLHRSAESELADLLAQSAFEPKLQGLFKAEHDRIWDFEIEPLDPVQCPFLT